MELTMAPTSVVGMVAVTVHKMGDRTAKQRVASWASHSERKKELR